MRIKGERLVYVGEPFTFDGVNKELDAEAAAADGAYFYISGSHAAKRKTCCDNPDSRRVYRLTIDETGHLRTMAHTASACGTRCAAFPSLRPSSFPATAGAKGLRAATASTSRAWPLRTGGCSSLCARRMWKETPTSSASTQRRFLKAAILRRRALATHAVGSKSALSRSDNRRRCALALVGPVTMSQSAELFDRRIEWPNEGDVRSKRTRNSRSGRAPLSEKRRADQAGSHHGARYQSRALSLACPLGRRGEWRAAWSSTFRASPKKKAPEERSSGALPLSPQRQQNDDRQRHAEHPKQDRPSHF